MSDLVFTATLMATGYLLGTIPTGYLAAKVRGVDIQRVGSGNIGATNVLRSVGILPAAVVAVVDLLKGFAATLLPQILGLNPLGTALTGLTTVLGNNFNIFLKLQGGKGIATSFGVLLAINPLVAGLAGLLGIITIATGRFVSLGSLVGAVSAPTLLIATTSFPTPHLYLFLALALLAFAQHQGNLARLATGTEPRLGEATPPTSRRQE